MAKNAGSIRSANNLLQVAGFLKQADKLVRERNYSLALEQIAKARAKDPTNSYAEAYEQRVQILLSALNEKKQAFTNSAALESSAPQFFAQHLENIASLAIQEAQRTASISLQQTFEEQALGTGSSNETSSLGRINVGTNSAKEKEHQIRRHIALAEHLLREQKFDEALNTLVPAILLDPLNNSILDLEREIHEAQEQKWLSRAREYRLKDELAAQAAELKEKEIQKCIQCAVNLSRRKLFPEALTVVGQGYKLDPFNASLENCEQSILDALARETADLSVKRTGETPNTGTEPYPPETKQKVLRFLDKAEKHLDEDKLLEALTEVSFSIIALQSEKGSARGDLTVGDEGARREGESLPSSQQPENAVLHRLSRQIYDFSDNAKTLAGGGDFNAALEELLKASFLMPSDGSLRELDYQIARKFLDYYQLMRMTKQSHSPDVPSERIAGTDTSKQEEPVKNPGESNVAEVTTSTTAQEFKHSAERQLAFEIAPADNLDDRISQIREHLLRSLRHLNGMKLVEASVEAELASLVDNSRDDVSAIAKAVAGLARKAKAQVSLNTLSGAYESIRQQTKDIIYGLWYEELLNGLDRVLEYVPSSMTFQQHRRDAAESYEALRQSAEIASGTDGLVLESLKKIRSVGRKAKKHPLEQIGLTFTASSATSDGHTLNDSSEVEAVDQQKQLRSGTW